MAFGRNRADPARSRRTGAARAPSPAPASDDWLYRLPAPEAHEGGESVWEAWQTESRRMDLAFAQTQPSGPVPLGQDRPLPQALGPSGVHWTMDEVTALSRRNNRVCPRPLQWLALYALLEGERYSDLQLPPVQPSMWGLLSNLQKRLRFKAQLEWADRHGKLDALARFISALPENDWVHMGEE